MFFFFIHIFYCFYVRQLDRDQEGARERVFSHDEAVGRLVGRSVVTSFCPSVDKFICPLVTSSNESLTEVHP